MKVKEAREILDPCVMSRESLYQRASKLFEEETEARIKLRSHGKSATRSTIEGVLAEMTTWFKKVTEGLCFPESGTPDRIIEWETGRVWVRHKQIDSRLEEWRKRTRLEMLKGSPLPAFQAMTKNSFDAAASMMLAQIQRDFAGVSEVLKKERALAEEKGLSPCPWRVEARHCEHCHSYSIAEELLPTSTSDIAFLCSLKEGEECPKFKKGEV